MKKLAVGLLGAALILASAPVAMAEYFVPPSNSAANQYTESLPTARGGANTNDGIEGGRPPKAVLGSKNADKLEAQGKEGREAAAVAAATAPATIRDDSAGEQEGKGEDGNGKGGEGKGEAGAGAGAAGGSGNGNGGGSGAGGTPQSGGAGNPSSQADPAGNGGFGEVLGKATGLSTEGSSLLLPLLVLAALVWSVGYAILQRRRPAA